MNQLKKLVLALLLLVATNAIAQQFPPLPIDPKVRYGQLENGLTYYIRHNEEPKQRAEFHIAQNVGAILENDDQNGLAHFLEHMAFNGTKNFPDKDIINYFEKQGVKFGRDINAYTSLDETVYRLSNVPTTRQGLLDTALLVLHDWSGFITLDGDEIENERGVIREEWRTGNDANRRIWKKTSELRYPGSQYAIRDVIGDTAVINNCSHEALRSYYEKWYRPDQQAIVIIGDIDVDYTEAKIKEMFADIPRKENFGERPIYEIHDNVEPIVAIATDVEAPQTQVRIDFKKDKLPQGIQLSAMGYSINIMHSLIGSILNERYSEIRQQPDAPFVMAFSFYGEIVKSKDAFISIAIPKEGYELEGFDAILLEIEKMRRFGFTESEVERAKTNYLKSMEKMYNERDKQNSQRIAQEYIKHFLSNTPIPGIETEYEMVQQFLPAISAEALNKVAESYITEENVIITVSGPEKEGVNIPTKEQLLASLNKVKTLELAGLAEEEEIQPLMAQLPKAGKVKKVTKNQAIETTEMVLSNGIKIIFKPTEFKKDEILFSAFSEGGLSKVSDINTLPSASFASAIVSSNGIGNHSATELRKALTGKIASVSPSIDRYSEGLSGSSSVQDFETMLQLVHLHFTQPRTDDNAYNALMNILRTVLSNAEKDPSKAFNDSIQKVASSRDPRVFVQDLAMVEKLDQEKALNVYKERFANPADFTFVFVGNINPEDKQVQQLLATYLGSLKTSKKREKFEDVYRLAPKGEVKNYFKREMETKTASNRIHYTAELPYNINTRITLTAIGNILSTRYLESIREREGGSYGVSVFGNVTNVPREQALLLMQFDTDPDKQERLMSIIHEEIDKIIKNGPLADDLQKVKENLLKQYAQDIEQNRWWANAIELYYEDGINHFRDYQKAVEGLTPEVIQSTLKEVVSQGNIMEVVMLPLD